MKPMSRLAIWLLVLLIFSAGGYYAGVHFGRHAENNNAHTALGDPNQLPRKILYYRNPMGLADTSPVPKQDTMGMDYVAVYEGEDSGSRTLSLSAEKVQMLGVRTEQVQLRKLQRIVRATALLEVDERQQHWLAPRFEGWVEQLQVNQTGQWVRAGTPLLTVYSPELESAAHEYQLARESGLTEVAQSARQRLANWGIAPQDLEGDTLSSPTRVLRAPISGVVVEKKAINGAHFAAGAGLFKLADLSVLWLQAEVAEQDQGSLRNGQSVEVKVDAYPAEKFTGHVSFIAPVLNETTRTVRVRVELDNRAGRLRPGMYANVMIAAGGDQPQLSVPLSAVIDSGTRQVVLVQLDAGRFQPREVRLGQRNDEWVAVLAGLNAGEQVVTRANFLIDAESNLRAALGGMQGAAMPDAAQQPIPEAGASAIASPPQRGDH